MDDKIENNVENNIHNKNIEEDTNESNETNYTPLKVLVGATLIFLVVLMSIPFYSIKLDPHPKYIPTLSEVFNDYSWDINNSHTLVGNLKKNDPIIKMTADRIVSLSCTHYSKICYAKALFYFVRDRLKYIPETNDYIETAKEVLMSGGSDCDGLSVLLANLELSVGIPVRYVHIPGHVYVEILLPDAPKKYKNENDWISLDPACKTCEFGKR